MFLGPYFPTPFTDLFAVMTPNYRYGLSRHHFCSKLEMRLLNCLEAYGNVKATEKCMDLFYDAYECQHGKLQNKRVEAIKAERERKYKAGEIKDKYSEKPPLDSFFHI